MSAEPGHGASFGIDGHGFTTIECDCGGLALPVPDHATGAELYGTHCREVTFEHLAPLLDAVDKVILAWVDPGPRAAFHKLEQERLLKRWPSLAGSVSRLADLYS